MRSIVLLFFAVAAIAQAPSFKPKPIGNLKQVMRSIPYPNSDIIFAVQGKAPKDEKEWQTVENAAIAISETATLITMPGRVRSNGQPVPVQRADWNKYAEGLVTAGQACYKAAQSKSQDAVSTCTDQLSDACENCHKVYRDNPQQK
jgi:cytochrome c556